MQHTNTKPAPRKGLPCKHPPPQQFDKLSATHFHCPAIQQLRTEDTDEVILKCLGGLQTALLRQRPSEYAVLRTQRGGKCAGSSSIHQILAKKQVPLAYRTWSTSDITHDLLSIACVVFGRTGCADRIRRQTGWFSRQVLRPLLQSTCVFSFDTLSTTRDHRVSL